ncbi:hypothetical protein PM082_014071 [Marasmius tenuissimus]|nr:hypothetical protein PM082_014071 [Marasmius tenuissimus]
MADLPSPFDIPSGRAVITTFHSLAILLTIYRISHRIRIKRFWGDDWLVSFALFVMGFYVASDWIRLSLRSNSSNEASEKSAILLKVNMSLSHSIIWCCRASLALSITRILPPGRRRTMSLLLALTCLLLGFLYAILVQTVCSMTVTQTTVATKGARFISCKGGSTLAAAIATSDIVSGIFLVALPLHCIWKASDIAKTERRLILILFASTTITLIPSVARVVYSIHQSAFALTYTSKLEVATSLIVCNLVVVVTRLYQVIFRRRDSESLRDDGTSFPPITTTHSGVSQTQDTQTRPEDESGRRGHISPPFFATSNFAEFTQFSDMYSLRTDATPHDTLITQIEAAHVSEAQSLTSSPTSKGQG